MKNTYLRSLFLACSVSAALLASATEPDLEALFDMNIEQLQEITVVTATKNSAKLKNVPANVRVITDTMIKERGYLSLEEALADLPGMQFRDIQGFNTYTFMRGAPSQNNLILMMVDGIVINELNSGGFYGGLHYNLANVKKIEVMYGPGSALYGTNAISGVINIITRSPKDESAQGAYASATAGSFDTKAADFRAAGYDKENDTGYSLSAMYKSTDKGDLGGAEGDNNWGDGMENFEEDLAFDAKLAFREFELGLILQDKKASRTTNYKSTGTDYYDRDTLWHITFMNIWARHDADLGNKTTLNSLLYYRDATVEDDTVAYITNGADNNQTGYYRPNNLFGIEEQLTFTGIDRLTLTTGLFYESENLAEGFSTSYSNSYLVTPSAPEQPALMNNTLKGIYLQGMYELTPALTLHAGFRHEKSSFYSNATTPRVSIVYNRDDLTAKLIYAEAFRSPKPWDYTWGTAGNPDLLPEEAKSTELFLGYKLAPQLQADVSLYTSTIKRKLAKAQDGSKWINQGELHVHGAELSLVYMNKNFNGYLNYTYTDSSDEHDETTDEIAMHTANAGLLYKLDSHLMANLGLNYAGERKNPATPDENIDAYTVANAKISYLGLNGWDLDLMVKNLLDEEYYHTSNRPVSKYRQSQRSLFARAGYRF